VFRESRLEASFEERLAKGRVPAADRSYDGPQVTATRRYSGRAEAVYVVSKSDPKRHATVSELSVRHGRRSSTFVARFRALLEPIRRSIKRLAGWAGFSLSCTRFPLTHC
jgi:hypothetical protein